MRWSCRWVRSFCSLGVALAALASAAGAATLTIAADKPGYVVGETIVLTITGDPEGGSASSIFGRLVYSAALTATVTSSQTQHTSFGGASSWTLGGLQRGDGFSDVFNQIGSGSDTVDQLQVATLTLVKEGAGNVLVSWETDAPNQLDFFGLTNAPSTVLLDVPEPASALLLAAGLLVLARAGRRRG